MNKAQEIIDEIISEDTVPQREKNIVEDGIAFEVLQDLTPSQIKRLTIQVGVKDD